MATTKLYLDKRNARKDNTYPLKIMINLGGKSALISLNVNLLPKEWNENTLQVIGRNDRQFLNLYITKRKSIIDCELLRLSESGEIRQYTAQSLKGHIEDILNGTHKHDDLFAQHFLTFAQQHKGRTIESYMGTYRHLQRFAGKDFDVLTFEDINKSWLIRFDNYLAQYAPSRNARNIHLRYIRAVFNDAIDNDITTCYPFRKFPIKNEVTAKRSLTIDQLRQLFAYPCEDWQQPYMDMFKLIFYLCGINIIDLCNLKEIINGRIEYHRAKTHKFYSIKIEPEAQAIIDKYKGTTALLNIADRYNSHKDYAKRLNKTIQHLGAYERVGRGGKKVYTPLFPNITTYWMRHTWATIAAELDIPDDTISRALGHSQTSGARVTQVYINFNNRKIDEANRRVIDYVLYGKR